MSINNVLVIVAHPDDEILGCGGTLAWHVKNGDNVFVLFLADGEGSRHTAQYNVNNKYSAREKMANNAADIIGIKETSFLRLPDNRMDSIPLLDIVQKIEPYIQQQSPNFIYTHHSGDLNIDHRMTHQAVMTACRPQPNFCVSSILCFEVPSSTEWQSPNSNTPFIPNWFVDISDTLKVKEEALKKYENELHSFPHARSWEAIKSLAKWRGASVGAEAAEAFVLTRHILN